jgi:hypothetical protein
MLPAPTQHGRRLRIAFARRRQLGEALVSNRASRACHRGWVSPRTTPEQFSCLQTRTRRPGFAFLLE